MEADEKAKQSALPPPLQRPSCAKSAPAAPPARDVSGQVVFGLLGRLLDPQQARSEQRVEILRQLCAEIDRVTATAGDRHTHHASAAAVNCQRHQRQLESVGLLTLQ